jgi:hypothetical protein
LGNPLRKSLEQDRVVRGHDALPLFDHLANAIIEGE